MRVLLRFILAIVFGFLGAFLARVVFHPQEAFLAILAIFSFGILGFILPEIAELAGKAGMAAIARHLVGYLQAAQPSYFSVPKFSFSRKRKGSKYANPMVLDTSVLIDGRIAEIARSGFLFGTFIVIPSVITELHKLADSADSMKRAKGRRGLDILEVLQKEKNAKVELVNTEPGDNEVDLKLVAVAKKMRAGLLTLDFNLNKVAKVKKVKVLNINELSAALKTTLLPGEKISLEIRDRGSGKGQGVGYLDDGTMVVVEGALNFRGKSIEVEVIRVIATAAGKMVFGKPVEVGNR